MDKADGHAKPLPRINHLREGLQEIDPYGIQSSKTAGEPPLVLAASVSLSHPTAAALKTGAVSCYTL